MKKKGYQHLFVASLCLCWIKTVTVNTFSLVPTIADIWDAGYGAWDSDPEGKTPGRYGRRRTQRWPLFRRRGSPSHAPGTTSTRSGVTLMLRDGMADIDGEDRNGTSFISYRGCITVISDSYHFPHLTNNSTVHQQTCTCGKRNIEQTRDSGGRRHAMLSGAANER